MFLGQNDSFRNSSVKEFQWKMTCIPIKRKDVKLEGKKLSNKTIP